MPKAFWEALIVATATLAVLFGTAPDSAVGGPAPRSPRICDDPPPISDISSIVACHYFDDLSEPKDLRAPPSVRATYRLFAGPSFQLPMVVRIDIESNDVATLSIRTRETVRNAQKNTHGIYQGSEKLRPEEIGQFLTAVDRSTFWSLPGEAVGPHVSVQPDGSQLVMVCGDGATAIIEALDGERYHVSSSGCGTMKGFLDLASTIMDLTRAKFRGLDRQWMVRFRDYLH